MKPGLAISAPGGSAATRSFANSMGFFFSCLASCMATLLDRSP
jgi:hypothetical protein